jgi:hypothetical protein
MNMKKILIGVVVLAVLAAGLFYAIGKSTSSYNQLGQATTTASQNIDTRAHIQIVRGQVFLLAADGVTKSSEYKDGDAVVAGSILLSGAATHANIIFPDGSALRMDENTKITLEKASYDATSGSLIARATLSLGKVWSKIVSLATPDSSWEVATPHAVATVRGTSFGTVYQGGKTMFVGGEHTVSVFVKDPMTGKAITKASVEFHEHETITLDNTLVTKVAEAENSSSVPQNLQYFIPVTQTTASVRNQAWILDSQKEDAKLDTEVHQIQNSTLDPKLFRELLLKKIEQDRMDRLQPKETPTQTNGSTGASSNTQTGASSSGTKPATSGTQSSGSGSTVGGSSSSSAQNFTDVQSIAISTGSRVYSTLVERDTVTFQAVGILSDGAKVTLPSNLLSWSTSGGIGAISSGGVFTGALDSSVAEIGQAPGKVAVQFRNPQTGATMNASTDYFIVKAYVPPDNGGEISP